MVSIIVGNGIDCSKWQGPFPKGKLASEWLLEGKEGGGGGMVKRQGIHLKKKNSAFYQFR